jgi:hypothetical protein
MMTNIVKGLIFIFFVVSYPAYLWLNGQKKNVATPVDVTREQGSFDFDQTIKENEKTKKDDAGCATENDLSKTDWSEVKKGKGLGTGGCSIK